VLTFTQAFYKRIWMDGSKVCDVFEQAKLDVGIKHSSDQADRFIITLAKDHPDKCSIFGNIPQGKHQVHNEHAMLRDLP